MALRRAEGSSALTTKAFEQAAKGFEAIVRNGDPTAPDRVLDAGPFYHGTKADLKPGDLLDVGFVSNYSDKKANFLYMTATVDAAVWGAELAQGWQQLEAHFGARFWPAIVPPWNRMAPYLPPFLAELRFQGLSQFGARTRREPVRGLVQVNTHVDIVFWKSVPARFAGAAKLIDEFTRHLAARRGGAADPNEPTGLLTPHAAHDAACWAFLETLFARLARHAAVTWLPVSAVFAQSKGMSSHRYPRRAITGDLARAGIGLVLCLGAAIVAGFDGFMAWLFGVCAAIFLLFGGIAAFLAFANH